MGTNTGLGIGIGIPFKNNALGGDKPYFPPELKARMIGVWTNYGKKNTDADRNIIKNKIPNAGGDLEILNAAYKLNSGFGEYSEDFTTWTKSSKITSVDSESFDFVTNVNWNLLYYKSNIGKDIPSFKVRIKLKGEGKVYYNYVTSEGVFVVKTINSEEYITPISYNTKYTGETPVNCGFTIGISNECSGTITQIPNFEDAFVTDGVNDLIISQKTVKEMIGDNDEITVISMVYYINTDVPARISITNDVRSMTAEDKSSQVFARNEVKIEGVGKLGIYGWSKKGASTTVYPYFNILGDKTDYGFSANYGLTDDAKFCPVGEPSLRFMSKQAHYWSFMVIGKLTEDEINLIIGNYNLDRSLKPDILCNIGKQGITNENHAEFNDKLIDYSGNGRDIQMNNLAWKGGSGIAAKPFETIKDYAIVSDEARQKLTIYNEFSYKIKSNTPSYYWTVQSIIKDNTSYQVTIITDKDCYWINATSFINSEGNKESIRKKYPVLANTPTQVIICGLDQFEYPEGIEPISAVSYVDLKYAGEVTVTFIPSCKGGLLLDGVNDFGKVTGLPIYKDYTVIADYERTDIGNIEGIGTSPVLSKSYTAGQGSFIMNFIASTGNSVRSYSFGTENTSNFNDLARQIFYQSKYKNQGFDITAGTGVDGDSLWLGTARDNDSRFFNGAIYSLMSFPYSMSEFLIERQLKKHKLGTLYPDMVEFRPVIKANNDYEIVYTAIIKPDNWQEISIGDYVTVGKSVAIQIKLNLPLEVTNVSSNSLADVSFYKEETGDNVYTIYGRLLDGKSPQKINITIDEYIRFEDIVQPYPVLLRFKDENGNEVSWGGKFRVGSTITRIGSAADSNLLPNIYNIFGLLLNGNQVTSSKVIVEKTMVFKAKSAYIFDNNEPKCILSPSRLRIPNSSYKILGYISDISGHGNHGVIHNSAYAEGSGVNEDGSYQLDGVDDFVTIPTVTGGKQMLMKVNWDSSDSALLYDQRGYNNEFAIYNGSADSDGNPIPAYSGRNNGQTYIDGILNSNIKASELRAITHNITITNELSAGVNKFSPVIGSNRLHNAYFVNMALYDFMLFDEISTDDKIKELNKYVGIEAKVELPPYYWDTYGKTNSDADRDTIQQRGVAVGDYDLINYNHAYEGMSGYNGYPVVFGESKTWEAQGTKDGDKYYIYTSNANKFNITQIKISSSLFYTYIKRNGELTSGNKDILSLTLKVTGLDYDKFYLAYYYLKSADVEVRNVINITSDGIYELPKSFASDGSLTETNSYIGLSFIKKSSEIPDIIQNVNVTIEVLPEYENGLVYDGVEDYSENVNVPALTDYTYIFKRTLLNKKYNSASIFKGSNQQSGGGAFICDYNSVEPDLLTQGYSFGAGLYVDSLNADSIVYGTRGSVNGQVITSGNNTDTEGLTIGKWRGYKQMVFYKLILYPKTIPLLQINFLKNLMEKDEIIDLTNPIFIKDE
jgi:hypothetical protein